MTPERLEQIKRTILYAMRNSSVDLLPITKELLREVEKNTEAKEGKECTAAIKK